MKTIAETIGVSRYQLYARVQGKSKPRHAYHKADDAALLPRIKRLVKERPTSGYRWITAHLNKELSLAGLATVMSWRAVHGSGISGSDVCDMMLEAVEARFGALQAPDTIEILTDNGSAYTAKDTQKFAKQLGLKPCFTPIASPQSNGMSEAFVRTFKRDYVEVNPVPDAKTVLGLIASWFEDYNDNHPHSGLRMLSPRDYIKSQNQTG